MTDHDWQKDPKLLAAAFEGMAEATHRPVEERLQLALQANKHLHAALLAAELDRNRAERLVRTLDDVTRKTGESVSIGAMAQELAVAHHDIAVMDVEHQQLLLRLGAHWKHRVTLMNDVIDAAKHWLNSPAHLSAHFHGCLEGVDGVLAGAIVSYEVAEGDGFDPAA